MEKKIKINIYVKSLEFKGQGVNSVVIELIVLVKIIHDFKKATSVKR